MANKDFKVKNGLDIQSPLPISMGGTGQTSATNTLNALLPIQTSNNGKYLTTDGSSVAWSTVTAGFTAMPSNLVSSNVSISSFNRYFVDTTAARTLTLPSVPSVGDEIWVIDASGTAATYNITVASNSNKINGSIQDLKVDVNNAVAVLLYTGATYGWKVG